jgi:apolipoprotein N-acyltransferase
VGTELLWPKLLADTIGQGLLAAPYWVQAADLFGAHGLTFVLVAANVLVADAVAAIRAHLRSEWSDALTRVVAALATVTVLVVALSAYGVAQWKRWQPQSPAQRIVVGVVQGNLSQYDRLRAELGSFGAVREILDRYMGLTRAVAPRGADFWAWPETMYPTTFGSPKSEAGRDFDHEILEFARGLQRPLAFGAYDRDAAGEYNAAFFVHESEDSRTHVEVYHKATPFPLTEWVPEWLEVLGLRERLRWLGSWKKGAGPAVVDLPLRSGRTVRVQPLICYDAVWPQLSASGARNGAELLLVFSNDSWFPSRQGRWLHLVASAFRSLETRRPQVRVTPTGFTAVVNARGEVAVLVPPDQPGAATVAVGLPGAGSLPLAARLGSWDLFAYLGVFPALLGVSLWRFANNARTVQSRVRKRNDAQEKIRD